jgi:hypothetical protein
MLFLQCSSLHFFFISCGVRIQACLNSKLLSLNAYHFAIGQFQYSVGSLKGWPSLWSSGQSSWLQIQRSGFHSWRYQIFREVLALKQGPLSFVITVEEILGRSCSSIGLEIREYGRGDPLRWPRGTVYPRICHLPRWQATVARSV